MGIRSRCTSPLEYGLKLLCRDGTVQSSDRGECWLSQRRSEGGWWSGGVGGCRRLMDACLLHLENQLRAMRSGRASPGAFFLRPGVPVPTPHSCLCLRRTLICTSGAKTCCERSHTPIIRVLFDSLLSLWTGFDTMYPTFDTRPALCNFRPARLHDSQEAGSETLHHFPCKSLCVW